MNIMALFDKNPNSYLGVDIGANGIKLVELKNASGRPQLWTYGIAKEATDIHAKSGEAKTADDLLLEKKSPHAKGKTKNEGKELETKILSDQNQMQVKKYASLLRQLVQKSKATSTMAAASLPVSYVFHTVLNLPEEDEKTIGPIVAAEIKKLLSRPAEEMQIIQQVIPQTETEKKKK